VPAITLHWKLQMLHCRYSSLPRRNDENPAPACWHDGQT